MRQPIDVIFCTHAWEVVHVVRQMPPRRVSRLLWKATHVVELAAGGARSVSVGDELAVEETSD